MTEYPVTLTPASDYDPGDIGYIVTFPDLPGAMTEGDTREEALLQAIDALRTWLDAAIEGRRDIPAPSPIEGDRVALPALAAAKVALYQGMRETGTGKAVLARSLGIHLPQVDRLLDLYHASRMDLVETALRAVGKELVVEVRNVPGDYPGHPRRAA